MSLVLAGLSLGVLPAGAEGAPPTPAALPLQVVQLDQEVRSRDDVVTVSVINGPAKVDKAFIRLQRDGRQYVLSAHYSPPVGAGASGVVRATLTSPNAEERLDLGRYWVVAELDGMPYPVPGHKRLDLVAPGNPEVRLDSFSPPATDTVWPLYLRLDSPGDGARIKAVQAVPMDLRGSGFQYGEAATDNLIVLNNSVQQVRWVESCAAAAGSESAGADPGIQARAISATEMRLCLVPVPPRGELRVQVMVGPRVSAAQRFLVYRLNTLYAALISGVIAAVLACIPLVLLQGLSRGYTIADKGEFKKRLLFLDPETDTYSLSKLQFYLWTLAALFSYSYLFIGRVFVQGQIWPDVPATLPGIIAVAAGTSIGSQVITSAKGSKGAGEQKPGLADFITSGGVVAPDRIQMLLWTVYGVLAFVFVALSTPPGSIQELPPIPEHLLYLMGLSSLGYLGGKMARKPGPVINEIAVAPTEPDDVLVALGGDGSAEMPDLRSAALTARQSSAFQAQPDSSVARGAVEALRAAVDQTVTAQTTADLQGLIEGLASSRSAAEQAALAMAEAYEAETADPAKKSRLGGDAALTQQAAAALQALSAEVTQIIAASAAVPMRLIAEPRPGPRTITLRGSNLSPEALWEIDHVELPFRMLVNAAGEHLPELVVREESSPALARMLKLHIDPLQLTGADLRQFSRWFGCAGTRTLTLTNPDGQKAEFVFQFPPGAAQPQATGATP